MKEFFDCLMTKKNALAIVRGEKKLEIRDVSDFYMRRFLDKSKPANQVPEFLPIFKFHFHNYTNTWFLDVEIIEMGWAYVNKQANKIFNERFNFHDLDEQAEEFDAIPEDDPQKPMVFWFELGKILDTNLTT